MSIPYPDGPFDLARTRISADMFTDEVRVYAVKGSRTRRAKSKAKVAKLINKGYTVFGTYDAWKSVGYHVVKGEKSKHSCTGGFFFTHEHVEGNAPYIPFTGWPDQDEDSYYEDDWIYQQY